MATLLVIDDDVDVRRTIARILRNAGYDIVEAGDGASGMAALQRDHPDLVITDIIMPDQEGIETIVRIRELSQVPIIAISGALVTGEFNALRDAMLIGADATLGKPFRADELLAQVRKLLPAEPKA